MKSLSETIQIKVIKQHFRVLLFNCPIFCKCIFKKFVEFVAGRTSDVKGLKLDKTKRVLTISFTTHWMAWSTSLLRS